MAKVFGTINLIVMMDTDENEEIALDEANHKLNMDRIIAYKLVAIDSSGQFIDVEVCDCVGMEFYDYVEC